MRIVPRDRRSAIRLTILLLASVLCAPLTSFAATATPPFAQPGLPPGVQGGQFPSGFSAPGVPGGQASFAPAGGRIGPTSPQQSMTLSISLKIADQHALDSFLHDLYDPNSPQYRHYLSPAEFTKRFLSSGRQTVVDFLKNAKLSVTDRGIGSIINATGTVDQVQTAFKVTISDYQDPSGATYAAADSGPTLPPTVSANIQAIVGLDNIIPPLKTHMVLAPTTDDAPLPADPAAATPTATSAATPPPGASGCDAALKIAANYGAYTPNQLSTAYNFTPFTQRGEQGQGQIVALMEVDDYNEVNVAAYESCFGTNVPISRVPVDGGTHPGRFQQEVELDIDAVIGMLPKLQQLLVYETDYRITAIIDSLQTMANDNLASVVSISFGGCEQNRNFNTFIMPEHIIFQQMAAQGMSVFAASGDSGSRDCLLHHTSSANSLAVDDPASQPYVTGVGGTKLTIDTTTNAYTSETVWNGFGSGSGAGGGGLSAVWPMQDYQTGQGVANTYSNGKRQVPDVAASADPKSGFIVYTMDPQTCARVTATVAQSCFMATGGTSVAAPIWAAAATVTNQHLTQAGYPRLGFANPIIYRLASSKSTVFHDITTGHNCYDPSCDGGDVRYPATVGYDMATGIGTFDADAFASAVLDTFPHITGTNPTSGPLAGGTTVTFTGSNFQQGATVSVGGVAATNVQVPDAGRITAVTPAHASGAADIEIVTGGIRFFFPGGYTYSAQAAPASPPVSTTASPTAPPPPTPSPPPAPQRLKVANTDGDSVNLRDKPDMKTGKIVATLPEGTEVQATGPPVDGDAGGWYPVRSGDTTGFIRAAYLVPITT